MLRIWDVFPAPNFSIPDPGLKKAPDPGSGSATKNLSAGIFFPLKLFPVLSCLKYDLDCLSQIWIFFHPGYGIPDSGVKKNTGSRILDPQHWILNSNTVFPGSGSGSGYAGGPAPGRHLRRPRLLCGQGRESPVFLSYQAFLFRTEIIWTIAYFLAGLQC